MGLRGEFKRVTHLGRRSAEQAEAERAFRLGVALEKGGDLVGAHKAYRSAEAKGHRRAGSSIGLLLARRGDHDGALRTFRLADERGTADGAFNLGAMLVQEGREEEAEEAFIRADARGHAAAPAIWAGFS